MASQSHSVSAGIGARYPGAARCRAKFLRAFPAGFRDPTYLAWERDYKWRAHTQWRSELTAPRLRALLAAGAARDIAATAVRIESRTNLLFSFEKMALRDAVRTPAGARQFAAGLYAWLHGRGSLAHRFARWSASVEALPRRQTRVWTWPVLTVFGFVAQPETHIFLKPTVTRIAAEKFGFDFAYAARPSWDVYADLLRFAAAVRASISDLRPRDLSTCSRSSGSRGRTNTDRRRYFGASTAVAADSIEAASMMPVCVEGYRPPPPGRAMRASPRRWWTSCATPGREASRAG